MANIEYYRALLPVNKYELDDILERHAQLQEEIGRAASAAEASATRAKNDLKSTEARLFLEIKRGGDRVSNEAANAEVQTHRERERCHEDMVRAQEDAAAWWKLYDSWQQRGWSIKALGELYSSEYFSLTSVSGERRDMPVDIQRVRSEQRSLVQRRGFKNDRT